MTDYAGYSIYALIDGAAYDDDYVENIAEAWEKFDALVKGYQNDARQGKLGGDATVHLYDPFFGVMVSEVHIPQHWS